MLYQFLDYFYLNNNQYQQQKIQEIKPQTVLDITPLIINSNQCWIFKNIFVFFKIERQFLELSSLVLW